MIIMHRKTGNHMIIPEELKKNLNKDLADALDVIVNHNLNLDNKVDIIDFCKATVKSYKDQTIIEKYFDE